MAAALDINILCKEILDLDEIIPVLTKYKVRIESVHSIDSWMWDNEQNVGSFNQIAAIVDLQHIVIIKLRHSQIKDMGIYIEKIENRYLYTLWLNTEGYPMLDCENITMDNQQFYKKIIQAIFELKRLIKGSFEVADVGLETDFCYEKNMRDIIHNSKNMMIWVLNQDATLNFCLDDFQGGILEDMYILQRKSGYSSLATLFE